MKHKSFKMPSAIAKLDRSGLHYAAANGHDEVMEILLSFGADYDANDKVTKHFHSNMLNIAFIKIIIE